jgi:hypothetical protein
MLLERGRVVDVDTPTKIARLYNQTNFRQLRIETGATPEEIPPETPVAAVRDARFCTNDGETAFTSNRGEACTVRMDVHFNAAAEDPIFSVSLLNETGHPAFITNTQVLHIDTGSFAADSDAQIDLRFDNWLAPGRYQLVASVARAGLGADIFDAHMSNSLLVISDAAGGGFADLPHTLRIERR